MKAAGGNNITSKDRKRKTSSDRADLSELERPKIPQSASRRHREKINATLEELGSLLPLSEDAKSKLDKLTVLKLSVSFFQTQNYLESGKRKRKVDSSAINEITKQFEECNINVSDISLEALDSFFIVLTQEGDVFFVSDNVSNYLGYTQAYLMHQNFLNFVHQDDVVGFKKCLQRSTKAKIVELDNKLNKSCKEEKPTHQVCFSSIKCHAGRQSSHVSPFYHRSFKFDGNIKPLLKGKMKRYGFFALCTAVNPANPFTSTPKEILQMYSCKMGLDLRICKLDNRGQKNLHLSDKDTVNTTAYLFAHPDDVPVLVLSHQQVNALGRTDTVFRIMNGNGVWQWVRGTARLLKNKNNQPEFIIADNVLLNDEQGPYYKRFASESLNEWLATQKSLPAPESHEQQSVEDSSADSPSTSSKTSEEMTHMQEDVAASDEEYVNSDRMEIPHDKRQTRQPSVPEKREQMSPNGYTKGPSQSCMFTENSLKKSPATTADEEVSCALDRVSYNDFKAERSNGDSVFSNSAVSEQINLIKEFLMQVDSKTGEAHDADSITASPFVDFPVRTSTEFDFQPDLNSEVLSPESPQNEMQASFHCGGPSLVQGVQAGPSRVQAVGTQHSSTTNVIFPFPANFGAREAVCGSTQNNHGLPSGMNELRTLQNGSDFIPAILLPEGRFDHSSHSRYLPSDDGLFMGDRETFYSPDPGSAQVGVYAMDGQMNPCGTALHRQNPNLFSKSTNAPQFNQDQSVFQLENVLNPDYLTSSLVPDHMYPFGSQEKYYSPPILEAAHAAFVCPSALPPPDLRQSVGQSFKGQSTPTVTRNSETAAQMYASGEDSILKMMLTL